MQAILSAAVGVLMLMIASAGVLAQDALVLLKRQTIDLGQRVHTLDLADAKGAFRALRIKAVAGPLTISRAVVRYTDLTSHLEDRRILLLTGERTREINPTTEGQFVESIELQIVVAPGRRAEVEIYGRQNTTEAERVRQDLPVVSEDRDAGGTGGGSTGKKKASRPTVSRSVSPEPVQRAPEVAAAEAPVEVMAGASADAGQPPCVAENTCTPVRVFFGTNRRRDDLPSRVAFSWQDTGATALGSAVVTVPRAAKRRTGQILTPTWWERTVLRIPAAGDPARHFVIVPNLLQVYSSEADFLAAVARHMAQAGAYKDHAFIYVHGYRVGFDDAVFRTAQIAYDLGVPRAEDGVIEPFGTPFLYSWPSAGQLKDYAYDQEKARVAIRRLRDFIELVITKSGAKQVHIVAHSMGNVPLLNALSQFVGRDVAGAKVSQIVLAAPDVGVNEFRELAEKVKSLASGLTLYASSSDFALEASRKVHKDEPRAGDVVAGRPLIAAGVDTIDISQITTCYFCFGHDEYVEQSTLLNDIAQLMRAGIRPPHSRTQNFKLQVDGAESFWRYQP
jgi:esterase/lipase superfamily enzyme